MSVPCPVGKAAGSRDRHPPRGPPPVTETPTEAPTETLRPGETSLAALERVYRTGAAVRLDRDSRQAVIRRGRAAPGGRGAGPGRSRREHRIREAGRHPHSARRDRGPAAQPGALPLRRAGERLPDAHVRLMMTLKLIALGRGASGVRPALTDCIEAMLARGVLPEIPVQGSVGASGDLAPLAHLAAAMIGEGKASFDGRPMPAGPRSKRPASRPSPWARRRGWRS